MKPKYQLSRLPDTDSITAAALAIEALAGKGIGPDDTCGCRPLAGLLAAAQSAPQVARGLAIERLDLRTSGDTAGPKDRVVGYGARALYEGVG